MVYGYDMSSNPVRYEDITTDKNGKFTIDPISPSNNSGYTIEATALGYYDYSSAGNKVANDVDTKITIVMRSEPSVDIEVRAVDKDTYADVSWDCGAKDALYLLENKGLKVTMHGRGTVVQQSIPPGETASPGKLITIMLK